MDIEDDWPEPIRPGYDPSTLREVYSDPTAARARAAELRSELRTAEEAISELLARADLVDLLLGLGELQDALAEAQRAADRADIAGTAAQQHLARIRLARAQQYLGDFASANALFTELAHAASQFGPIIEAFTAQAAGANDYDQGLYVEALSSFERALALRSEYEVEQAEIAQSRLSVQAARRRAQ